MLSHYLFKDFLLSTLWTGFIGAVRYEPTWDSLDTRPLPTWFDESKLGIFIHWGVFSQIGFHSEWVWYAWKGSKDADVVQYFADNFPPDITYADFAKEFSASLFDPNQWVDLIAASGAKYVVLTSKHCDGFTLWPSKHSFNWNAMDVGPHRDLVGELANAIRHRSKLHFGLYHSLMEWFHPLYLQDKANNWTTQTFPVTKTMPELYEIINTYKPDLLWSDGEWEAPDVYWNSTNFVAWLYNESPVKDVVATNDRWGADLPCHHGGYFTCVDGYNPGVLQPKKWENCMELDNHSWGYRRNINNGDVSTIEHLIATFAATVSCGGNLLLNIGPTGDGTIPPIFQERLVQLGQWMDINNEAIYRTVPWSSQNDTINPDVWYTSKKEAEGVVVYAVILKWNANATVVLGAPSVTVNTVINVLGYPAPLKYRNLDRGIEVVLPGLQELAPPHAWGYVLKLTKLSNQTRPRQILALPERFRSHSKVRTY